MGSKKRDRRPPAKVAAQRGAKANASDRAAADLRRGDAVTVAWMLAAVFALAGEIVALVGLLSTRWGIPLGDARVIQLVGQIALLVATTAALLCLALTPLVYRFRADPPPEAVTYATIVIAAAPIMTATAQWLSAR